MFNCIAYLHHRKQLRLYSGSAKPFHFSYKEYYIHLWKCISAIRMKRILKLAEQLIKSELVTKEPIFLIRRIHTQLENHFMLSTRNKEINQESTCLEPILILTLLNWMFSMIFTQIWNSKQNQFEKQAKFAHSESKIQFLLLQPNSLINKIAKKV